MFRYRVVIILFFCSLKVSGNETQLDLKLIQAKEPIITFANDPTVQSKSGLMLTSFDSGQLITGEGNIATDNQNLTLSVTSSSDFGLKILDNEIMPGQEVTVEVPVDSDGHIKFNIYPLSKGEVGTATFSADIEKIYSVLDEVWLADHEQADDWVDINQRRNYGPWLPAFNRQMANFIQTRSYDEVYNRDVYQIEKEQHSGKERQAGKLRIEDKGEPSEESRNVVAKHTEWVNQGEVINCGSWTPNTDTVKKGQSFTQTGTCDQSQIRYWHYYVDDEELYNHDQVRTIQVSSTRTEQGTKPDKTWHSQSSLIPTTICDSEYLHIKNGSVVVPTLGASCNATGQIYVPRNGYDQNFCNAEVFTCE